MDPLQLQRNGFSLENLSNSLGVDINLINPIGLRRLIVFIVLVETPATE